MKKKVFHIGLIIIIIVTSLLIIKNYINEKDDNAKTKNDNLKICNTITNDIKNKKDLILYFQSEESIVAVSQVSNYLKKTYPNLSIHTLKIRDKESKCIKQMLEANDLYREILSPSTMVVYKQGIYQSFLINANDQEIVENHLEKQRVIAKKEIIEKINLEQFKENIKNDKYILLVVMNEKSREYYEIALKEKMSEYKYDIINLNSKKGEKIAIYINENFKSADEFPQAYYFSKGILKTNKTIYGEESLTELKKIITEK